MADIIARGLAKKATEKADANTVQLAQEAKQLINIKKPQIGLNECIVTFVDDDGKTDFLTKFKPTFDAKSIKANVAVNTSTLGGGGYYTYDQLRQLDSEGFEISSHGHTHETISLVLDDVAAKFILSESQRLLALNGLKANTYVYAGSPAAPYADTRQRELVKQYYDCGVATQNGILNTTPLDTYCLTRYDLNSDLTSLKAIVDNHIANKSWLIFMSHSWMPAFDATKTQMISDLIDYIQSKSVKIVTLSKGLDLIGNAIEIGNPNLQNYYALSKNGKVRGTMPVQVEGGDQGVYIRSNLDDSITAFNPKSITVNKISSSATGTYPPNGAGIGSLTTYRFSPADDRFAYQIFKYVSNDDMYSRRWDATNLIWLAWVKFNNSAPYTGLQVTYAENTIAFEAPASAYPYKAITQVAYNTAGSATSPSGNKGIMITYRLESASDQYTFQEWKSYQKNTVYMRYWTGAAWSAWKIISDNQPLSTTNRNTLVANGLTAGDMVFDTTLNKPVWAKTVGAKEVDTLTVSTGATVTGNITITLNGTATTVSVTAGDTVGVIGDKIRATAFSGWVASGTSGSATVVFTKINNGVCSAPTFTDTGATGITASFAVTTAGTNNVWVDSTGATV